MVQPNGRDSMLKRIFIAFAVMIAALGFGVSSASAESSPAASDAFGVQLVGAGTTEAGVLACDYRVWALDGVNAHRSRDRSSPIVKHYPHNHVFRGITCEDTAGGNYGSCGTGFLWKSLGNSYVASKCLARA